MTRTSQGRHLQAPEYGHWEINNGLTGTSVRDGGSAALPQIGDASSLDAERILALQPDLVIGWKSGNRSADLARLERLGLKLFVIEPVVLDDVVIWTTKPGHVIGVDRTTGAELWNLRINAGTLSSPLVVDGRVWVCPTGKDGRSLAAYDADSGAEVVRAGSDRASYASPMLATSSPPDSASSASSGKPQSCSPTISR